MIKFFQKLFTKKQPTQEELNEQEHKTLMQNLDAQRGTLFRIASLTKTYVTNSGAVYYRYSDISNIPYERFEKMQELSLYLEYGLNREFVKQFEQGMSNAIEKGDMNAIRLWWAQYKEVGNSIAKDKIWLQYALLFLVRHNENPYTYTEEAEREKLNDCLNDSDLRSFFLSFAYLLISKQEGLFAKMNSFGITSERSFLKHFLSQTINQVLKTD